MAGMSEEGSFGLNVAEKFFGFIVFIVGVLGLYFTVTSTGALMTFTGFFGFLSVVLIVIGFVLMTAKIE
jgi:hypothetical protein